MCKFLSLPAGSPAAIFPGKNQKTQAGGFASQPFGWFAFIDGLIG
jgi:hypothetical protein